MRGRLAGIAVLLAAVTGGLGPMTALASPGGIPPPCEHTDGGGPGGGNGTDPCERTTTTSASTTTTSAPTTTTSAPTTTTSAPTTTTSAPTTTTLAPTKTTTTTTSTTTTTTTTSTTTTTTTTTTSTSTSTTVPTGTSEPGANPGASAPSPASPAGLGKIDLTEVEGYLAAAISIVEKADERSSASPAASPDPLGGPSGGIDHFLGLAVPPMLAGAVGSPIVVLEALVSAMTSSSQSLIIPGIVFLAGLPAGRRRRRHNANLALIGVQHGGGSAGF